jgi:hypothetical protein
MIDKVTYKNHKKTRKADDAYALFLGPPSSPPMTYMKNNDETK